MTTDFEAAYQRERSARKLAEQLLTEKTRELYDKVVELEVQHQLLRETQQQLVDSEKMAAIGHLTAGLAHELNNPLAIAMSNLQFLATEAPSFIASVTETATELAQDLSCAIQDTLDAFVRIQTIVGYLVSYDHVGQGAVDTKGCKELMQDALALSEAASLEIDWCIPTSMQLNVRVQDMTIALRHLFDNAYQAHASRLKITCLPAAEIPKVVTLTIQDNGHGMSDATRKSAKNPFFTTRPVGQGRGLGLAMADNIVRQHGGELSLTSAEGQGCQVTLRLPQSE